MTEHLTLKQRFDALENNLKLDAAELARAIAAHNNLGAKLILAGIAKRCRLQGSLARKTMLPPLKDIDKVIELVDQLRELLDVPGGPEKAMALIQQHLEPTMPNVTFEVKKHALGICTPGDGFDFDAVPAFNEDDGTGWIKIADTEDDDWEPSNTYLLIDVIAERNKRCNGKFVHQVRMVKQAVREAGLSGVLPGIHIETFTFAAVTEPMAHADSVIVTLAAADRLLASGYMDPTGVDRISERLSPEKLRAARAGIAGLAQHTAEAGRLAAAGNEDGAARIWAGVFGEVFPAPPADAERTFLQQLHAGGSVASTGVVTARVPTPSTRAWRPA